MENGPTLFVVIILSKVCQIVVWINTLIHYLHMQLTI